MINTSWITKKIFGWWKIKLLVLSTSTQGMTVYAQNVTDNSLFTCSSVLFVIFHFRQRKQ